MNILSSKRKKFIRKVTREEYLVSCELFNRNPHNKKQKEFILSNSRRLISVRLDSGKPFQSIIGRLLISIAMKMAMELIEQWIEDNIFTEEKLSEKFQEGEVGYVKR